MKPFGKILQKSFTDALNQIKISKKLATSQS